MASYALLQYKSQLAFKNICSLEILQFDIGSFIDHSFASIFLKIKELNFFRSSMMYLQFAERKTSTDRYDEFGDYKFQLITAEDYLLITYDEFSQKCKWYDKPENKIFNSVANTLTEVEVNQLIEKAINNNLTPSGLFYLLMKVDEQANKYAFGSLWENFKHFIYLNQEKNIIQLITMGFD